MRTTLWLALPAAAVAAILGLAASCAIDDEVVWISGGRCTGSCEADGLGPPASSCDTDRSCTPDCVEDWDCPPADGPPDAGVDGTVGDAILGDTGTRDDTTDDPEAGESDAVVPPTCLPDGGADPGAAERLVMDGGAVALRACAETSAWFAFDAAAGVRFAIDFSLAEGALGVRLYDGDAQAVLWQNTIAAGASTIEATAGRTGRYLIRIRAELGSPLPYRLAVRNAANPRPE
jgi:hypothetical protein